jgi:putative ABC transport system permease protein
MFALLFVTGNTMMQSVRARIPELAVLKTYGFSNTAVMSLVLAESVVLCSVSAMLGIGIAAVISPPIYRQFGAGGLNLPVAVVAVGMGLAILFAIVSASLPALRAQRLSIVDALAGR